MDARRLTESRHRSKGPRRTGQRQIGWRQIGWRQWFGWTLLCLLLTGAAAGAWRVAQLDGLLQPIRVSGPSMSPTLWGPHRQVSCPRCGLAHRVHAQGPFRAGHLAGQSGPAALRCFGCGNRGASVSDSVEAGDRVLIDRAAYLGSAPQRGDLVAIAMPSGGLQVKRVIGLPGEVLQLSDQGEVLIDGHRLRMSPEQSWQRSVLVYDDNGQVPSGTGEPADSRWRCASTGDWRVYHHEDIHSPSSDDPTGWGEPAPIRDDDPANAHLSRQTRPVADLQLAVWVQPAPHQTLELEFFADGGPPISASIELAADEHLVRVTKLGDTLWQLRSEQPARRIDHSHSIVHAHSSTPAAHTSAPPLDNTRPVAVRLRGSHQPGISRLWLGRSVRYDPPRQYAELWTRGVTVAADHYIVLGDNPPASVDSRSDPQGVPLNRILGHVTPWQ